MARAKYDPLEAAKIGADGERPQSPPSEMFRAPEPVEDLPAPVVRTKFAVPMRAPKYRVLELSRISIDGQICIFRKGDIVDSAGYGAEKGIARLISQGLKVERVQG